MTITMKNEDQQSFAMDNVTITMSSKGRVDWVVDAEQAFTAESDKQISLIGVNALYTDEAQKQTRITSDKGKYDVNKSHLVLIDHVVVDQKASQQKMYTDLLHYYGDRELVVSPGRVEIQGKDFNIKAGSMEYYLAARDYVFSGRVVCQF